MDNQEALGILRLNVVAGNKKMPPTVMAALKRGIEALERHEARSHLTYSGLLQPLPSESLDSESP